MKKGILLSYLFILFSTSAYALSGFTVAAGTGSHGSLRGTHLSLFWDWKRAWQPIKHITISGFWDLSAAYFSTNGDYLGRHPELASFAIAPVFRIGTDPHLSWVVSPYLLLSVGGAIHTNNRIGNHELGSVFSFQDMLGIGLSFGKKQEFSLNYLYLHYSNAHIFPPNDGINGKYLFEMIYRFA